LRKYWHRALRAAACPSDKLQLSLLYGCGLKPGEIVRFLKNAAETHGGSFMAMQSSFWRTEALHRKEIERVALGWRLRKAVNQRA
jgi:hypothetical protein